MVIQFQSAGFDPGEGAGSTGSMGVIRFESVGLTYTNEHGQPVPWANLV